METLDRLFAEARNEAPETTLGDVQKWIVPMTLGALIVAFFAKTKVIVTLKPFIMISSAIVTVGIGAGTIFLLNTSTEQEQKKPVVTQEITVPTKQNPKPNEIALTPVDAPSQKPVVNGEQQPVLRMLETLNDDVVLLPSLSYCQSLPMEYILPYKPFGPVAPHRNLPATGETIETTEFTTLNIWGAVDVVLLQGDKPSYRIEMKEENPNVEVSITNKGKTLEIYSDCKGKGGKNDCIYDLTVYVTMVNLNTIDCSGASTLKSEGQLNFENLEIELSGASDLELNLKATKVRLRSSGASDAALEGTTENISIENTGASDVNAEELEAKKVEVSCSGAGVVTVNVKDDLKAKASGASEVFYKGSPSNVTKEVTGASEIKNIK